MKISNFLFDKKTLTGDQALAKAVIDRYGAPDIPLELPVARILLDAMFGTYGVPPKLVEGFRGEFFRSQRVSIDAFAARWPEFDRAAKLAIATVLLFCESEQRLNGDWYQQLLEAILRNEHAFKSSGLEVITFNYDRSLDLYLHRALMSFCRNDPRECAEFRKRIRITHVYGVTGELWPAAGMEHAIGYGDISKIGEAASHLGLVRGGEKVEAPPARDAIQSARKIVFLDFSFWRENLDVLNIPPNGRRLSGSAMGLPKIIREDLMNEFQGIDLGREDLNIMGFLLENSVFEFPKQQPASPGRYRVVDENRPANDLLN